MSIPLWVSRYGILVIDLIHPSLGIIMTEAITGDS